VASTIHQSLHLGYHATEEAAARACDNYAEDGDAPLESGERTSSRFKGVSWDKSNGTWKARCMGKGLGYHATEEAAALAYDNYVKDGVDSVKRREGTSSSRFKGVSWNKSHGNWTAECKGKRLGCHATEEAAAQAYNIEVKRIGRVGINVILPTGDADDGDDGDSTAAPAALALLSLAACAHAHAGVGSKRAGAPTPPAPPRRKRIRPDTSSGAPAGDLGGHGRLVVAVQGQQ